MKIKAHLEKPSAQLAKLQFVGKIQDVVDFVENSMPMATNKDGDLEIFQRNGDIVKVKKNGYLSKEI